MYYESGRRGAYTVAGYHNPLSIRTMQILFRPDVWVANTVYYRFDSDNANVVLPSVFNGLYYEVENPGKSTSTEPTWATVAGDITTQAGTGLTFQAKNYNLLPPSESITGVTYAGTNGVIVTNTAFTGTGCQFTIPLLPQAAIDAGEFTLTIIGTKNTGDTTDPINLRFKVG
jgi:hypothetical protein